MTLTNGLTNGLTGGVTGGSIPSAPRLYVNVLVFGASNIGASAYNNSSIFTNQINTFDSERFFKVNPATNELMVYATPVNNTGSSAYTLINEDMYYGITESLITELGTLNPTKKIAVVSGCKSTIPVAINTNTGWLTSRNASDPFDMTTRYGQVITRAKTLMDATGEPIDLIYLPDAGGDATVDHAGTAAAVVSGYELGIPLLRSDLNIPNAKCIIPNLGATPENISIYPRWVETRTAMRDDLTLPSNTFMIDPSRDLGIDIESGIQYEWPYTGRSGNFSIGTTLDGDTSAESGKISFFNNGQSKVWTETQIEYTAGEGITASNGTTATLTDPLAPATVHYNTDSLNRLGALAGDVSYPRTQYLPSLFRDRWTPSFTLFEQANGSFTTDFDFETIKPTGTIKYVKKGGDNTANGNTLETAYASIQKAYDVGANIIKISTGFYDLDDGLNNIAPNGQDVCFEAVDGAGTVILSQSYRSLTWVEDATYSGVWTATAASVMCVVDRGNTHTGEYLSNGIDEVPINMLRQTSIANVSANAGSFYENGSSVSVKRSDGSEPNDNDVKVLNEQRIMWFVYGTNQKFIWDGLELWGRAAVRCEHSAINTNIMGARNCGIRYSDFSTNLIGTLGTKSSYYINCHASDHVNADGFNHATTSQSYTPNVLEDNCSARRCGNSGATNDNSFTAHNEANLLRLNCYGVATAPIFADTSGAYSVNLNCSTGVASNTGTAQSRVGFQIGVASSYTGTVTSKMWTKNCTADGEYWARGQATGGVFNDLGGFTDNTTGGDYGTITVL